MLKTIVVTSILGWEYVMKRTLVSSVVAIAFVLAFGLQVAAQEQASLVGVWKQVTFQQKEVATGKIIEPFGPNPQGRAIYTADGFFTSLSTASDRKVIPPDVSDEERTKSFAALFTSMYGFSGRYKVDGNTITFTNEVAAGPSWVGRTNKQTFTLTGDKLKLESAPFTTIRGVEVIAIITLERLK